MPIQFSYKAHKYARELFTGYQGITEEQPEITTVQLITCIRLITQQVERIFGNLSDALNAKEVISSIIQEDVETADIVELGASCPLKEFKQDSAGQLKQSALLGKLGLLGEKTALSLEEQTEKRKQTVAEAIRVLRGLLKQDKACYLKHLPSGILPDTPEKREALLMKLIPEVATIVDIHLFGVVDDVNAKILRAALCKAASKVEESPSDVSLTQDKETLRIG